MSTNLLALKPFKGIKRQELKEIPFPCALSFKIDGFRCMSYNSAAMSSTAKKLPNEYVQAQFRKHASILAGLDGELVVGNPWDKNLMQQTSSGITSQDGEPEFHYWVFDDFTDITLSFKERYAKYCERVNLVNSHLESIGERPFLRAVEYRNVNNEEEYGAMQNEAARIGYEGTYGKDWQGTYKHGRSGKVNPSCWKDKPWTDEEGTITGFVEMMENTNEAFIDELGRTKRSTAKAGLVGKGILGSYIVENPKYKDESGKNIPFNVSCGSMTMEEREKRWPGRDSEIGERIKYRFFDFGVVDVPRSAVYDSHRPDWDDPEI